MVVNLSGRGDKDLDSVAACLGRKSDEHRIDAALRRAESRKAAPPS